jgi:hypothetical protein
MSEPSPDDLDALIDAAAALLKLEIEPDWLPAIRANLEVTLDHARNVEAFPLSDDAEPACIFEA